MAASLPASLAAALTRARRSVSESGVHRMRRPGDSVMSTRAWVDEEPTTWAHMARTFVRPEMMPRQLPAVPEMHMPAAGLGVRRWE